MESEGWIFVVAFVVGLMAGGLGVGVPLNTQERTRGCDAMCEERLHRYEDGTCYCAETADTWQECTWDGGCPREATP
jgi:hypothetical protein